MKQRLITLTVCLLLCAQAGAAAAGKHTEESYGKFVQERLRAGIDALAHSPENRSAKKANSGVDIWKALLLLNENKRIEEAEQSVLRFCGNPLTKVVVGRIVAENRTEAVFRIYLTEKTRGRLSQGTQTVIEDYAWLLLTEHHRGINRASADKPFWDFRHSENHYVNDRRRYTQALQIVRKSARYGPHHLLEGESIESHYQAWNVFWIRYFQVRAGQGTDMEIAHPSSYGSCTVGVYYDLYDLTDSPPLRELAGKFLTLYWAEVAAEFEPRTGDRAVAATRNTFYDGERTHWARSLLSCYGWHEGGPADGALGNLPFLMSDYRPPEILRAIASDPKRGPYQATSRRALMIEAKKDPGLIIFDEKADGHFRRDVFYTPDYMLSTMTLDPARQYHTVGDQAQTMGVNFASDQKDRIVVTGTGYYGRRAINGITGTGVSIIARDPNAQFGRERFMSEGTRVFVRHGALWDNRVEDASGWFFTRAGDAYAAIRAAGPGYDVTARTYVWPDRELQEVEEKHGRQLELKDMWAPIVIQMGRAADYASFDAFQAAVKARTFAYENGKLTYVSEAKDTFEYWAKGTQPPKINGETVNLNPAKTYDSPFLSMEHGSSKAVIHYPGYKDEVLEFGR